MLKKVKMMLMQNETSQIIILTAIMLNAKLTHKVSKTYLKYYPFMTIFIPETVSEVSYKYLKKKIKRIIV